MATGSTAVRADSLHYRSDLLLNGSILLALLLAGYGWPQLDALFGLGIAFYILWSAVQIARESTAILMDKELPGDVAEQMLALVILLANPSNFTFWVLLGYALLLIAAGLTLWSMLQYLRAAWPHLRTTVEKK